MLDQEKCIGCHACTTACKQENGVPVGSFRTWVKYVERGKYPEVRRHFTVLRCMQCTKPPCVDICPVNALTKRPDGIVDIDRDACIGCRACMQACPYDALYLNEDLGAVEKCHFCAHRVEQGLQPACVNVCPVGAIIPGDFHDPNSAVSVIRKNALLTTRRAEQKTGPNVWYVGADESSLIPGSAERLDSYLWSQKPEHRPEPWPIGQSDNGERITDSPDSDPGSRTPDLGPVVEVLNAEHKIEWGWPVALYLVTKGIAGGIAMLAPLLGVLGIADSVPWWYPETVSLVFTLITVGLLIEDLKKPAHFYKLFTRPNWKSWLVKGGIVLTVFGAVTALILVLGMIPQPTNWPPGSLSSGEQSQGLFDSYYGPALQFIPVLRWWNLVIGAAVAGYTAFLFAQCKGRDLWESKWLLPHLLVQAVMCGAAVLMPFAGISMGPAILFFAALALHFVFVSHELHRKETMNARQAAAFLEKLRFGPLTFLIVSAMLLLVAAIGAPMIPIVACLVGLSGLYAYEHAFIRAGQLPPLS